MKFDVICYAALFKELTNQRNYYLFARPLAYLLHKPSSWHHVHDGLHHLRRPPRSHHRPFRHPRLHQLCVRRNGICIHKKLFLESVTIFLFINDTNNGFIGVNWVQNCKKMSWNIGRCLSYYFLILESRVTKILFPDFANIYGKFKNSIHEISPRKKVRNTGILKSDWKWF
jgi:hypothetical protein